MSGEIAYMDYIGQTECMASSDAELGHAWVGGADNGHAASLSST
jgi:hypothetical protein